MIEQRGEFVRMAAQNAVPMRELCRRFGVSAPTGYKWLVRYREAGEAGLEDQSRRPREHPTRTSAAMEQEVCELRGAHPRWGGRKIHAALVRRGLAGVPAASTITGILRRHGLLVDDQPQRGGFLRFEHPAPNDLWQMDFKGPFAISGGQCHPLGVLDDHSRFNVCLAACGDQRTGTVKERLVGAFDRYGLPRAILTDNGPPWGHGGHRWTRLGVWLLDVGVDVRHSRPYHPQTQGKEERFHQTLGLEVISSRPVWDSMAQVQGAFDRWRHIYNYERPHDSLDLAVPGDRYRPSSRSLPRGLLPLDYPPGVEVRRVDRSRIYFRGRVFRVPIAFAGRSVGLRATTTDGVFDVIYRHRRLRSVDLAGADV